MKKILLSSLFLICIGLSFLNAFAKTFDEKEITLDYLNSKNLLNYIKDNELETLVKKVCSKDMCIPINFKTIESDIKTFINQNLKYLKSKNMELGLEAELKGFKIEKIVLN